MHVLTLENGTENFDIKHGNENIKKNLAKSSR
jgi:hypothetical protein